MILISLPCLFSYHYRLIKRTMYKGFTACYSPPKECTSKSATTLEMLLLHVHNRPKRPEIKKLRFLNSDQRTS